MRKSTTIDPRATIGLDLGDRKTTACVLEGAAGQPHRFTVTTTPEALSQRFGTLERARIVMEAGTHSPWASRCLEGLGHEVVVANPRRVRLIGGEKKTDRIDAEKLARLARADVALLSPLRHREERLQADLAMVRARDRAVAARTALVNHVRGAVKSAGGRVPRSSTPGFVDKASASLPAELGPALRPLLRGIEALTRVIGRYDRAVAKACRERYPSTRLLCQVSGVGALTALTFVLVVGSPDRFGRSRRIGAYVGLCPRVAQSGADDPELSITRAGDTLLRRLLVQSAHYILGPFGPDCTLRRVGMRRMAGGGRWAKKRAVVTVARRLAVLLLSLWKSAEVYDPLRNAPPLPSTPE